MALIEDRQGQYRALELQLCSSRLAFFHAFIAIVHSLGSFWQAESINAYMYTQLFVLLLLVLLPVCSPFGEIDIPSM